MYKEIKRSSAANYYECREVIGKTVENIIVDTHDSGQALISFTDGTFLILDIYEDYYGNAHGIQYDTLTLTWWNRSLLKNSGIMSEEELKEIFTEIENARNEKCLQEDRETWERLGKKYGWREVE